MVSRDVRLQGFQCLLRTCRSNGSLAAWSGHGWQVTRRAAVTSGCHRLTVQAAWGACHFGRAKQWAGKQQGRRAPTAGSIRLLPTRQPSLPIAQVCRDEGGTSPMSAQLPGCSHSLVQHSLAQPPHICILDLHIEQPLLSAQRYTPAATPGCQAGACARHPADTCPAACALLLSRHTHQHVTHLSTGA